MKNANEITNPYVIMQLSENFDVNDKSILDLLHDKLQNKGECQFDEDKKQITIIYNNIDNTYDLDFTVLKDFSYYVIGISGDLKGNLAYLNLNNFKSLKCVNINNISITDGKGIFGECKSLEEILQLDTSKVTDMRFMFKGCKSLTTIP